MMVGVSLYRLKIVLNVLVVRLCHFMTGSLGEEKALTRHKHRRASSRYYDKERQERVSYSLS